MIHIKILRPDDSSHWSVEWSSLYQFKNSPQSLRAKRNQNKAAVELNVHQESHGILFYLAEYSVCSQVSLKFWWIIQSFKKKTTSLIFGKILEARMWQHKHKRLLWSASLHQRSEAPESKRRWIKSTCGLCRRLTRWFHSGWIPNEADGLSKCAKSCKRQFRCNRNGVQCTVYIMLHQNRGCVCVCICVLRERQSERKRVRE